MNGDALEIIKKMTEIDTKQEERHGENIRTNKLLFQKIDKLDERLDNLPCGVHTEKFKKYDAHVDGGPTRVMWGVGILVTILLVVVASGMSLAEQWGEAKNRIDTVEVQLEKHIEGVSDAGAKRQGL